MQDKHKTKQQLIEELVSLRAQFELRENGREDTIRSEANPIIATKLYAMIFDQFPLGISVIRKDGFFIYVNPAFVSLTGYTLPDIDKEKKWFQTAYPDKEYRRKALYAWVKYQTQQIITEKIFQVTCKNGKKKSIEFNMITVTGGTVISILTDVTGCGEAEELLREKEEQWRLLLDTMNEGFITVNESGIPVFVNQRFCEMTGYTQEELIGRPVSAYLDAENLRTFQSEFSQRSNGRLSPYEIVLKRKDGSPMYFLMSPRPLYDSSGRFAGSFGTCMDITERKAMEKALKESEEKFAVAFYESAIPMAMTTIKDGRYVDVNEAFAKTMGLTRGEIIGNTSIGIGYITAEQRSVFLSELNEKGYVENLELQVRTKDGEVRYGLFNSTRISIANEDYFLTMVTDITDKKHLEESLRESENKYRTIVENTNDAIYINDFEGNILDVNDNACRMVGYERDELVGANLVKIDEDWRSPVNVDLDVLLADDRNVFERENIRKDGSVIPVEVSVKVVSREGKGIVNAFVRNISKRKRVEEALRERKERLKKLADNLPGVVYQFYIRKNGDMGLYYVSERSQEILGVDNNPDDFFAHASACVPVEDKSRLLESIQQAALTVSKWEYEGRFITPIGEERYIHGVSIPEQRPDEVVFNGMLLDITEQKRAEDALEESRKRYQDLIESINESVWEIDATGRFTYISPSIEKLIGYEQREIVGRLPYEFAWAKDMEKLKEGFYDSFDTHYSFDSVAGIIVHKRGVHVAVEVSGNPFYVKEGLFGGYRGIMRDISEIKRLQEEMIKSQKLESIGTLAGGVAHDFNNLLMGILGYIGLAKLNAQQEMVVERSLSKAEESCMRAKELAQRLLTFSRGGDPLMKPIDIRDAVRESVKLVLSGSNIQCRYYLAKHLHPVRADEAQIRQAIGNIIINAVEASPAGGSISVKGENVHYRRKAEKPFIKLTISDRGKGISKESLRSIFDPYFTTKDMGSLKGTGLGLSISYSIIKKHGGDITVQSEVGKGTSVSIYLPAYGDITQVKGTVKEESPISGRPEASVKRILVMDDEALIRSFMEDTMSFLGYDVTTCDEGSKAVEMYREAMASRPYDLVVLDLTVRGGMGGQDTIQRLLDVDPAVTAIICSGYTDDPVISHCGAYGFKEAWVKPVSIDQIKTTLKTILNK
ncbi:MAG: PAS domain S-box protein [Deltaproteobacteria bacterium]|nr:PAS domain S-box protein [Deltaproteobacteria bacterium]